MNVPVVNSQEAPSSQNKEKINTFINSSINYMLPTIGENVPDYLKRVELDIKVQDNLKPEWSILTVQPLYQSEDKQNTVFTQLSQRRYEYLGTDRDVTNIGFGYRQLFADNTVLAGVNTFYDYEWKRQHKRGGVGAEVKWSGLDFTTNMYKALSDKSGKGLSGDTQEEVLDGRDFELSAQVPYLPWAKIHASRYYWDSVANAEDVKGWSTSLEAKVQQNITVEAGLTDDNFIAKRAKFARVTFSIPFGEPRPVMASSQLVSNTAWDMRDMREYTLDKVRRQNKIIVERTTSGVVITRGN
ncbi:inverse autotransporter beta domain-containing protein [Magnetovibrio blakemorei]|uniref:inverse autotransporter beta domain-containing protein n=1 Tax=Magnetovibrio blakemorei TaxID=28181 RepID=UPI00147995DD|nr:inverse autotransporter beta domain-containing protein [Magnetovibrio blakemorei]